jgi:2-polyprenyl-3-methyl-5-hydroxy-6-metoxy-1,4-benzoquinol methylase
LKLEQDAQAISDEGERVTHLYPNSSYQAHLSLYMFAAPYATGGDVLDAGAGAGYGSHYLATHGARSVEAIDVSEKAIAFSRKHFVEPNLRYRAMDLEQITGFAPHSFDLIFSSNTLEHVPHVTRFFASAWQLLRPSGVCIVAVPPVYDAGSVAANLANPYHLNIWSPRQWHYALSRYFGAVACIRHHVEVDGRSLNFADAPETRQFQVEEFIFLPSSVEELCAIGALTAVFVASEPRPAAELVETGGSPDTMEMIDDSFTRPPGELPKQGSKGAVQTLLPEAWMARWQAWRKGR